MGLIDKFFNFDVFVQENEVSSISTDGRIINLTNPLRFTHHSVSETLEDGQFIELR